MRRKIKSLFKIAITFVTVGVIMVIAGLLMGGAGELSKEVTELVHLVRVGVSESVERIPLLERITNINGFTVDIDEFSVKINEEYETIVGDYTNLSLADASEVTNMDISVFNGTCRIVPSRNDCFGVQSVGAEEFQCYVADGTLYLSVVPQDLGNKEESEITLYVPDGHTYQKVFLFCSAEQVEISASLKGEELSMSSICGSNIVNGEIDFDHTTITAGIGELSVETLVADELKLEISTAEAVVGDMEAGNVEVNLGMGSLEITGITMGDIILNCGMGHLDMALACAQEDYNYDISGSAESVQIGTDTLAGMVMERWIDNGAERKIAMSCSMGSVAIEFDE